MKTKLLLLMTALLWTLTAVQAQESKTQKKKERKVTLEGKVYDSFTKVPLKAKLTLMDADSVVCDTMTSKVWEWKVAYSYFTFEVPAVSKKYILKATCEGYETTYLNYSLRCYARNTEYELPRILMKKKTEEDIYKEVGLDGVVITGTKVKIAYKGDTVVYNASAFNLPEGSMLDGLIREMPGAELKDNGDIYINGQKVDFLTLNGKDFFKGDNKVMLDNLPYYTVDKVQVYHKSTKKSERLGREVEKKDYVMDVQLKRQYNRGLLMNAEAGGGTSDRYLARLFGLYYTDHTHISAFAQANNINETRSPGNDGEWKPSDQPQGLKATKQTGFNLTTENADKTYEENFSVRLQHSDNDNEQHISSETFSSDGNIFGGNQFKSRHNMNYLFANNHFVFQHNKTMVFTSADFLYNKGKLGSSSQDSTWRTAFINQSSNVSHTQYTSLSASARITASQKLPWGDLLAGDIYFERKSDKPNDYYNRQQIYYAQTGEQTWQQRYNDTHSNSYNWGVGLSYDYNLLNNWDIEASLGTEQSYESNHNSTYRIDQLDGVQPDTLQLTWLPSNREMLNSVLDQENTTNHHTRSSVQTTRLSIKHSGDNTWLQLTAILTFHTERMRFRSLGIDTLAKRNYTHPQLHFYYVNWAKKGRNINASYDLQLTQPNFASLMPVMNTSDPLHIQLYNPNRKASIQQSASFKIDFNNDSTKRATTLSIDGELTQRAIGTRTQYNTTTGVRTTMQDNVNGNWTLNSYVRHYRPLDKAKRLSIDLSTSLRYTHSVDFDISYDEETSDLRKVNTVTLDPQLTLSYTLKKLTARLNASYVLRRSTSNATDFETLLTHDFTYGASLKYTLPWKIDLGTDLKMYSRRGYQSSQMNTDDLVWNAQLSRSFLKGRLTAKLIAFDLLHQLSSINYSVNAQGRTETWYNCIPRYAMLTLSYKFQKMPKKKK